MSTPYVFNEELPALVTPAAADVLMVNDVSAGVMKRITLTNVETIIQPLARGAAATSTIGFYGATAVDQGTMTATAVTSLAAATMSAGNAAGVWAWASSTEATAFVTRARQAQADLDTLMARINSTGLVAVTGL